MLLKSIYIENYQSKNLIRKKKAACTSLVIVPNTISVSEGVLRKLLLLSIAFPSSLANFIYLLCADISQLFDLVWCLIQNHQTSCPYLSNPYFLFLEILVPWYINAKAWWTKLSGQFYLFCIYFTYHIFNAIVGSSRKMQELAKFYLGCPQLRYFPTTWIVIYPA